MDKFRLYWAMALSVLAACPASTPVQVVPRAAKSPISTAPAEKPAQPELAPARLSYPASARDNIIDELHSQKVADPYRWLEDVRDERVQAWMRAQDDLTRSYLARLPGREELKKRLTELNYHDSVSVPTRRKGRYFYTRRHADKEKAILYWRDGENGQEIALIDPNTLSDDGSVALGGYWPSHDGRKLAYKLKKNNADAATMYVMDVDTGKTSDSDVIDGAKYAYATWSPDNKGFYYTKLPTDPQITVADLPGHAHVRYHALGEAPDKDALIHPATQNPRQFIYPNLSKDGRYLFISIAYGWHANDVYFKDLKARRKQRAGLTKEPLPVWQQYGFEPLVKGIPAIFQVEPWKGSFYVLTNHQAPRYRVFKVDARNPAMDRWREIVPEDGNAVIENMNVVGNHLVLTYLRDAHNQLEVRTLDGQKVREATLPGLGSASNMIGNEDEDEAYYLYTSFTEPSQIYRTSVKSGESTLWAKVELPVDTTQMVVEQVWYASKDGTRVSMFLIHRKDVEPNGQNPTLLSGYGGFNISMTPYFSNEVVAWVERGGVYAIPNLRGGGEYGEEWHKAGMLLNKQNVFDDFIAAARYLIAERWTSPERLAISGGSNGGLLVGAAMTQEPGLFRAVVCAVPLLDMVRYHLFGSGKTWIAEYGSADDPEQFAALLAYSPYHRVQGGQKYPSLLMLSADSDDRVDPMHARKFVAAMQWAQAALAPVLLRIEKNAGHGGADLVRQRVEQDADRFAFLMQELGMH